jgi:hypothetical protein
MSSYSLGNAKAGQFMAREASYSTHGSRRGFVDIDLPIPESQLSDASETLNALLQRKQELSLAISNNRHILGIKKGKPLKTYANSARRGGYKGSTDMSRLLLTTLAMAEKYAEIQDNYNSLKRQSGISMPRPDTTCFIDATHELLPHDLVQKIWARAAEINKIKGIKKEAIDG